MFAFKPPEKVIMAELSPAFEHEPLPPSGEGALDEGQKETKSSRDTSSTGAEVKQAILEIPNGQAIDGQPVAPGPQYKRGRGRSFFKDAPRKGISCQGRLIFPVGWKEPKESFSASQTIIIT